MIQHGIDELQYDVLEHNWRGVSGLRRLSEWVEKSKLTAVDQPFSYSHETLCLLTEPDNASGDKEAPAYSSRRTDEAMRRILSSHGLTTNYVMSPNRCQNIWRALALAKLCGLSRTDVCMCKSKIIETHPRVAWAVLLGSLSKTRLQHLITQYKGTANHGAEVATRRDMLSIFEQSTGIRPAGGSDSERESVRTRAVDNADNIEAIVCALVAFLHDQQSTTLSGSTADLINLATEGAAVLPSEPWVQPESECP